MPPHSPRRGRACRPLPGTQSHADLNVYRGLPMDRVDHFDDAPVLDDTVETFVAPIIPENIPGTVNGRGKSRFVPSKTAQIPITARELVEWSYAVRRAQYVREITLEPAGRSQTGIVVDLLTEYAAL